MEPAAARVDPELPIFRLVRGDRRVLYTPGHVAIVPASQRETEALERLREPARRAVAGWNEQAAAPFSPERLTVYLSNRCNLACSYCFAASGPASPVIDEEAVYSAARLVARCAAVKGRPLHLVLHGGGEPTLHWELVRRLAAGTRRIADAAGTGWFGFVATNGVLSETRARWLAHNFDLIGLSCDGPRDIQNRHRPSRSGQPTSVAVERTTREVAESGGHVSVRATITPETAARQAEIVAYLHGRLGAREVRFEPAYKVRGSGPPVFQPADAPGFVANFLQAQREARARGCELRFAGVCLDELHGPYCNVLQDALHLLPDGAVSACFFRVGATGAGDPLIVGHWDPASGEYRLDNRQIAAHRAQAAAIPPRCHDCVNIYHCARECPEVCCRLDPSLDRAPGFRCLLQRRLAEEWILDAAGQLACPIGSALHSRAPSLT